ncbi:uncharacterized protein LOC142355846 [Convolutriloba macropyga]|uniref:uncharacterized protein LOC142355846 n=1 Tax=Convolutriloba macropyga TaxID=536237 RepID=UPI003F5242E9
MPTISHIKRRIHHIKQQQRGSGPIPKTDDFEIPEKYLTTKKGDDFLFGDGNVQQSEKRFLIFGTEYNLQLLSDNKQWFVDGTFKSCPDNFNQIFTVHCLDNGITVPCIYALLPDKKQDTYVAFWENLIDSLSHPDTIMTDFECASKNAATEAFPNTEVVGCFFSFLSISI